MKRIWVIEYRMDEGGTWFRCDPLLAFNSYEEADARAEERRNAYSNTIYHAVPYVREEK